MNLNAPSWLVDFLEAVSVWDLVLFVAGFIAVCLFIRHKGWRWIKAFARGILNAGEILVAVEGLPAFIARVDERLEGVYHETHKNDGSSIKDATIRTENAVERIEMGMKSVSDRLDDLAMADSSQALIADDLAERVDALEDTLTKETP